MAKRKQDKIKHFRGKKQAVQASTDAWMIGNVGPSVAQAPNTTQEPPFYVDATMCIEPLGSEPVTITRGRKSTRGKQKPTQKAAPTRAMLPIPPAITTALTMTPEVAPNTKPQAAAVPRARLTQEVDEDSGHELDDADMGAFYQEHDEVEEEEEEDEEDGVGVQIVTPRGKTPAGLPETAGVEVEGSLTVVQYQAIIRDYKERLLMAERQVRAISKTSLADRFMENEVRKYVKESLWKRCKFITCTETMSDCMNEVAAQFGIVGDKREHWKSTYAHAVRDALNNRRNNTSQDLKKELSGKWPRQGLPC